MKARIDMLFDRDYAYAVAHGYDNTVMALDYIKSSHLDVKVTVPMLQEYLIHGLSMAWMLIELQLPVSHEEMDIMLSASVLHILTELYGEYDVDGLGKSIGMPEQVVTFLHQIPLSNKYYGMIVEDRLLLIIKMVERSNVIEHLCDMTTDEAKQFMMEAKCYLFSMCIDGKERYPEFDGAFTGILEKMRGLIQVMDILFKRYDLEEDELYEEILVLKEENARIRMALENN